MSGGWNPMTGRDAGAGRPPFAPYGAPTASQQGQPYIYHSGGPGYGSSFRGAAGPAYGAYSTGYPGMLNAGGYGGPPPAGAGTGGYWAQHTFSQQPNGVGNAYARQPQVWPAIDATMPAAQMSNSTGGVGCEPGYNYFFPAAHTKVHVFITSTPPWQLPASTQMTFKATHIPCNTTVADLLKGFGCTNPIAKKNRVVEITSGGGGKWYRGLEINGADEESLVKTIRQLGWDETRTGNEGQKPVVCLWFCKD